MSNCLGLAEFEKLASSTGSESELQRIRDHLSKCPTCRTAHSQYAGRKGRAPASPSPPAPAASPDLTVSNASDSSPSGKTPKYIPRIEGYRITGVLGQGGMGVVYRAVQTKLNRSVALKVLPSIVGSASPSAVSRFRREATAAARLHHTHIVPIYDFGESRDAYYYAMELIEGQPLNTLIKMFSEHNIATASPARLATVIHQSTTSGGAAPAPAPDVEIDRSSASSASMSTISSSTGRGRAYYQQVARWIADAAEALHYAHGQGIIHRDIKPGNLILSSDGRIMITDFGLAKSAADESVTITGSLLGTIRYLSPEQAMAGRIAVDHRTDIYSLGATMYELLCFQPAFPGHDDKQVLAAIITRDPLTPRKVIHTVPQELETICQKSLEKSPDRRYESAKALAEDLRRYLNDMPIAAKRPGVTRRMTKFIRRHRTPVVAIVAVVAVGIAAAGYYLAERGRRVAELRSRAWALESYVADADRASGAGEWDQAAELYEAALRIEANYVPALVNLAIVKRNIYNNRKPSDEQLLEDAVRHLQLAVALEPKKTKPWNTLGVVFKMQRKYEDAVAAYQKAVDLDPTDPVTLDNLAIVNALRRDLESCERILREAVDSAAAHSPTFCHPLRDLAMVQLARRNPEAFSNISKAMACAGDPDAVAIIIRARLYLTLEGRIDFDKALDDAKAADLIAKYKNPIVKRYLAWAYLRKEKFDDAIDHAREALALGDAPCMNQLIIANAGSRDGRNDEAKSAWNSSVSACAGTLNEPDDYLSDAPKGVLWIETAFEKLQLQSETAVLFR